MIPTAASELLLDRYELTMADSYLAQGIEGDPAAFELFVRRLPHDRGYLVAAGLEGALAYLEELRFTPRALDYVRSAGICSDRLCSYLADFRFTGDVDAVPEGTVVDAGEPLVRVEGPRLAAQIVESYLLTWINFQTLIATKASRVVDAARGAPVVDFGFRRAHGPQAGLLAARAAYIGGVEATATVAAGELWGIPTTGTMAHSYVLSFSTELEAFCAFLRDQPGNATLLIDTYDTLDGARAAVEASHLTGVVPQAVRLDSGDVALLGPEVRAILDEGGLAGSGIVCSGDLDEHRIAALVAADVPITGFGVGTELVTSGDAPALGGVYKLVESDGRPVMKRAAEKSTLPGRHQVWRDDDGRDTIGLVDDALPGRPLLEPVMRAGRRLGAPPSLDEIRRRRAAEVAALPGDRRALAAPTLVPVGLSPRLSSLKESLDVPA